MNPIELLTSIAVQPEMKLKTLPMIILEHNLSNVRKYNLILINCSKNRNRLIAREVLMVKRNTATTMRMRRKTEKLYKKESRKVNVRIKKDRCKNLKTLASLQS